MKTFLNLTNGLLYEGDYDGFIRIQSNHAEGKHKWNKIIRGTDSNFLMYVALGYETQVVDYSMKNKPTTCALGIGLDYVWYCCCRIWNIEYKHDPNYLSVFNEQFELLTRSERRTIKYFRTYLNNPVKPKVLSGLAIEDDNKPFYRELALKKYAPKEERIVGKKELARLEEINP